MSGTVSIIEYARQMGYSHKHIYEQIRMGRIPAKKLRSASTGQWSWQIPRDYFEDALKAKRP